MKKVILIAVFVAAVAATIAYTLMRSPPESGPLHTTGNYAEDWMKYCGAMKDGAQRSCTADLDARYGRVAGAPVPPANDQTPPPAPETDQSAGDGH